MLKCVGHKYPCVRMVEFEVLGTDTTVDPTQPADAAVKILYLILGAAVLFMALPIGQQLGEKINDFLASLTGADVGDSSSGMTFGDD